MDHEVMSIPTARRLGVLNNLASARVVDKKVDQHSLPDLHSTLPVYLNLSLSGISEAFLGRLQREPDVIQIMDNITLFKMWTTLDEELQRRAQPIFEPLEDCDNDIDDIEGELRAWGDSYIFE